MKNETELAVQAYESTGTPRHRSIANPPTNELAGPKVGYCSISVDGDPVVAPWHLVAKCILEGGDLSDDEAEQVTEELEGRIAEAQPGLADRLFVDCSANRVWDVHVCNSTTSSEVEWFQGETGFSLPGLISKIVKDIWRRTG